MTNYNHSDSELIQPELPKTLKQDTVFYLDRKHNVESPLCMGYKLQFHSTARTVLA